MPEKDLRSRPRDLRAMHSFAVCAYGESPYLEACLRSLKAQTVPSEILICTSTPNRHIEGLAAKYGIPLMVRDVQREGGARGIGADWNYAFRSAGGEYVTLAHQDDMYEKHYTEAVLREAERWRDMDLFTCSAVTVKNGRPERFPGLPEIVKTILRVPLRFRSLSHLTWVKRLVLRFGNAVICPSVAYRKRAVEAMMESGDTGGKSGSTCSSTPGTAGPFSETRKFILDWEFLFDFAAVHGRWICDETPRMFYRVHGGAATAECIRDHAREREEEEMFRKLWPRKAADLILKFYRRSYDAYQQ